MSSGQLSDKIIKKIPSIEEISLEILIRAYKNVIKTNQYDVDWEEEQFSSHLVSFMKKSLLRKKYHLYIGIEKKFLNENELPIKDNDPKRAPRIDINIASWKFVKNEESEYFFEAKNLYENNWNKKVASKYYNRYIDTGIENFRINKYYNGSLIGYVLQGNITIIIDKINIQLKKDRKMNKAVNCLSPIEKIDYIKDFSYCYESMHNGKDKKLKIKHIFLKF